MTAYGKHIDRLWREIETYLAFMDEARVDDHLWREYKAFCYLTDRIAAYSMYL